MVQRRSASKKLKKGVFAGGCKFDLIVQRPANEDLTGVVWRCFTTYRPSPVCPCNVRVPYQTWTGWLEAQVVARRSLLGAVSA